MGNNEIEDGLLRLGTEASMVSCLPFVLQTLAEWIGAGADGAVQLPARADTAAGGESGEPQCELQPELDDERIPGDGLMMDTSSQQHVQPLHLPHRAHRQRV